MTPDPELLALCSGKFETQLDPLPPPLDRHSSDSSNISAHGARVGPKGSARISKLLGSTGVVTQDKSTLESIDMNEVLGLCSGAFPTTQQENTSKQSPLFTKFGADVRGIEGHPSLDHSSSSESGGEGGELLSWARRQKKLTSMLARGDHREGEEDDVMPKLTRKRKRGRPKPKATKE